jgi:hypothetical protein
MRDGLGRAIAMGSVFCSVLACTPEVAPTEDGPVGTIELALTAVPPDALCLRVKVEGTRSIERLFDLDPGRGVLLSMGGVSEGAVTVTEEAFGISCRHVGDDSAITWMTEAPAAATVSAGRTTQVSITLRPTGRLRFDNNFDDSGIALSSASAELEATTIGGSSRALTLVVKNVGRVPTGPLMASVQGRDRGDFVITANPCRTLAPSQTCAIMVALRPLTAGPKVATLVVTGTPGGQAVAALAGVGLTPPALVLSPSEHDFGTLDAGTSSGPFTFSVRNTGQTEAPGPVFTLTATSVGGLAFDVLSNGCRVAALGPSAECVLTVQATASAVLGSGFVQTATLVVMSSDGASTTSFLRLTIR